MNPVQRTEKLVLGDPFNGGSGVPVEVDVAIDTAGNRFAAQVSSIKKFCLETRLLDSICH